MNIYINLYIYPPQKFALINFLIISMDVEYEERVGFYGQCPLYGYYLKNDTNARDRTSNYEPFDQSHSIMFDCSADVIVLGMFRREVKFLRKHQQGEKHIFYHKENKNISEGEFEMKEYNRDVINFVHDTEEIDEETKYFANHISLSKTHCGILGLICNGDFNEDDCEKICYKEKDLDIAKYLHSQVYMVGSDKILLALDNDEELNHDVPYLHKPMLPSYNKFTHIECGDNFTLALNLNGRVWSWGLSDSGA